MFKLFVTISAGYGTNFTVKDAEDLAKAKEEFLEEMRNELTEAGLTVKRIKDEFIFDRLSFSHANVVQLLEEHRYDYANFGGVSFPTSKYSDNGTDSEYYLVKRFLDYDITVCINISKFKILISDMIYVQVKEK